MCNPSLHWLIIECVQMAEDEGCEYSALTRRYWEDRADADKDARPAVPSMAQRGGPRALDLQQLGGAEAQSPEAFARREKMAHFEGQLTRVEEGIFVGADAVAQRWELLHSKGITHVVNASASASPNYFAHLGLHYLPLKLSDSPNEDLTSVLYDVFDFVHCARSSGGSVLIHCSQGVSRSVALATALLMRSHGLAYDDAFRRIKSARSIANPNMGFACQLVQWQKRVPSVQQEQIADGSLPSSDHVTRASGAFSPGSVAGSTSKCYIVLPLNQSEPSYCVAKAHHPPSAGLDPRGAYVIRTSSFVFVWIGSKVSHEPQRKAHTFAEQLGRYEGAPMPPVEVRQGEEPDGLLAAVAEGTSQRSNRRPQVHYRHASLDHELSLVNGELDMAEEDGSGEDLPPSSTGAKAGRRYEKWESGESKDDKVPEAMDPDDIVYEPEHMCLGMQRSSAKHDKGIWKERDRNEDKTRRRRGERRSEDEEEREEEKAERDARERRGRSRAWRLPEAELFEYTAKESLGTVFDMKDLDTTSAYVLAVPELEEERRRWVRMRVWLGKEYEEKMEQAEEPEAMAAWVAGQLALAEGEWEWDVEREGEEEQGFWRDVEVVG
jgi:predicted protein tyrosine phosphatase